MAKVKMLTNPLTQTDGKFGVISTSKACESAAMRPYRVGVQENLDSCKYACLSDSKCNALDWSGKSNGCKFFERPCEQPQVVDGASSYVRLDYQPSKAKPTTTPGQFV